MHMAETGYTNILKLFFNEVVPESNYCDIYIHKKQKVKTCKFTIGSFCDKPIGAEDDYCEKYLRMKD